MVVISIILRCRLARKSAPRPIRFAWGSTPAWPRTYFPRTWPGELWIGWAIIGNASSVTCRTTARSSGGTGTRCPGCSSTSRACSRSDRSSTVTAACRSFEFSIAASPDFGISACPVTKRSPNCSANSTTTTTNDPLRHDPGASRLAGSEQYVQPDGTMPIGPNRLLPKKKNSSGAPARPMRG